MTMPGPTRLRSDRTSRKGSVRLAGCHRGRRSAGAARRWRRKPASGTTLVSMRSPPTNSTSAFTPALKACDITSSATASAQKTHRRFRTAGIPCQWRLPHLNCDLTGDCGKHVPSSSTSSEKHFDWLSCGPIAPSSCKRDEAACPGLPPPPLIGAGVIGYVINMLPGR